MRLRNLFALLVAACGGGDGGGGGADAAPPDAPSSACQVEPGVSYVVSSFWLLDATMGFDFDDDGSPDNALGALPESYLTRINDEYADELSRGIILSVAHITGWDGGPTADDPDIGFGLYVALDSDVPPDPSDNFSGSEDFLVLSSQFDLDCHPTVDTDGGSIVARTLQVEGSTWGFPQPPAGTIEVLDVRVVMTFAEDFASADAQTGGVVTLCTLSNVPFVGNTSGTFLDFLVNDAEVAAAVHPDYDIDGDGLESVAGDGVGVQSCRDGDGTTIEGPDCPCDTRIADAMSLAIGAHLVPARITGVTDPP